MQPYCLAWNTRADFLNSTFPVNTSGYTTKAPTGTSHWDPAWVTALSSVPPLSSEHRPTLQPQSRALTSTSVVDNSMYLLLHLRVLFDSFNSNNVGFQLGWHANQPVQVCCNLQGRKVREQLTLNRLPATNKKHGTTKVLEFHGMHKHRQDLG